MPFLTSTFLLSTLSTQSSVRGQTSSDILLHPSFFPAVVAKSRRIRTLVLLHGGGSGGSGGGGMEEEEEELCCIYNRRIISRKYEVRTTEIHPQHTTYYYMSCVAKDDAKRFR